MSFTVCCHLCCPTPPRPGQMMGRAGRPQYDTKGVAVVMVHEPKKAFYKRFLYEPFPVESSLQDQVRHEWEAGGVAQEGVVEDAFAMPGKVRREERACSHADDAAASRGCSCTCQLRCCI